MPPKRKLFGLLFWNSIAVVLLLGARQIVGDPTSFGPSERTPIIISEFLAAQPANEAAAVDDVAQAVGWIELHNRSNRSINLANWTLTDDPADPEKWVFPNIEISPEQYLVVWARNAQIPQEINEPLIANVDLFPQGGFLALYPPTASRFADAVLIDYPAQLAQTSFGRADLGARDGAYRYLASSSRGQANDENVIWQGRLDPVVASVGRGFFDAPFDVALESENVSLRSAKVEIRYTLDGSTPTEQHGTIYEAPIWIERTALLRATAFMPGYLPSETATHSYLFLDDVVQQSADPSRDSPIDWPQSWGTHRITFLGYDEGTPVEPDYEMDPDLIADPNYGPQMIDSLLTSPSLSVVTDMENLDIYFRDPQMRGLAAERAASVEFLYPNEPQRNLQSGVGIRIQGGTGRWEYMPKHSLRLFFKQQYGALRLRHYVFDDSPLDSFNTLTLRAGVDRSFAGNPDTRDGLGDHRLTTYTRDEFARDSQIVMSGFGAHGRFAHLYLNGLYWGIYNMVERPDRAFASDYFGGEVEEWFTATHGGAGDGQVDRFVVMLQLAQAGGLADPEKYATMLEFVDPIQFSDYMILNWYIGNRDWPESNWYANVRYPAGRNLFFVWDAENSWTDGAALRLGPEPNSGSPFPNVAKLLFNALIENANYRQILADRLAKHLHPRGALGDAQAQARWRAISEPLTTAIIAESARWGDARNDDPITQADWFAANEAVLAQMVGNADRLLQQVREAGYFPSIDPPAFSQHGGLFDGQLAVTVDIGSAQGGEIFYTVDGTDPVEAGALRYESPVPIDRSLTLKARRHLDGGWSALTEAHFQRADQLSDVRITEIMYNPLDGSEFGAEARPADDYEFVEIKNVGDVEVDLSLAFFEGITFVFPNYTTIAAGETKVLIRDFRAFRQRYPTADFHGIYSGKLSNRGEAIALRDVRGNVLDSVTYDDGNGWPASADGMGDSLVLMRLDGGLEQALSWGASLKLHGSPGE